MAKFYFKGKPLRGTIWGEQNRRIILVHIERFTFSTQVHKGRRLKSGFESYSIPWEKNKIIYHYWTDSWKQLFEKHKRYVEREGEARYKNGNRTTFKKIIFNPFKAFKHCFWNKKGYRDGLRGFLLSLFWAWYSVSSEISLYKYQKTRDK